MQQVTSEISFQVEMLSIEAFANRMGVNRTTIYDWLKSGHLRAGRHFIRLGGTVRFPWGPELCNRLMEDSVEPQPKPETKESEPEKEPLRHPQPARKRESQINLNY